MSPHPLIATGGTRMVGVPHMTEPHCPRTAPRGRSLTETSALRELPVLCMPPPSPAQSRTPAPSTHAIDHIYPPLFAPARRPNTTPRERHATPTCRPCACAYPAEHGADGAPRVMPGRAVCSWRSVHSIILCACAARRARRVRAPPAPAIARAPLRRDQKTPPRPRCYWQRARRGAKGPSSCNVSRAHSATWQYMPHVHIRRFSLPSRVELLSSRCHARVLDRATKPNKTKSRGNPRG